MYGYDTWSGGTDYSAMDGPGGPILRGARPRRDRVTLSIIVRWISSYFAADTHQILSSTRIQISLECTCSQQQNGASLVFIHCMVLEIELFLLMFSNKHDAKDFSGWKQAELQASDVHHCAAEDLTLQ